jgi:hypothetical protein
MVEKMSLKDAFPPSDHVQDLYCDDCEGHLDLAFTDFHREVSGIDISIKGLPVLRCEKCSKDYLPEWSRFAIIEHHKQAAEKGVSTVRVVRKNLKKDFGFTKVPFLYEADDYHYIPGLERPWNAGFLTPVFFNRKALLKYDADPAYQVKFASTTYGTIDTEESSIAFGINKNGKLVMWLGDIASLPESEQYYLRSENVPSDHSIGSEFYEGQIDCIYTPPSLENKVFALRSAFLDSCTERFGIKIACLDNEVYDLALDFIGPVIDTEKARAHVADTLNKIYVESFDNGALGTIMTKGGLDPKNLGSLKRLQAVFASVGDAADIASALSPFYVLYDLRVAYSHLTPTSTAAAKLELVTDRLCIEQSAGLMAIYAELMSRMAAAFEKLTKLVKASTLPSQGSVTGPP